MNLTVQLGSLREQSLLLSDNERAELACTYAKKFEKIGEYEAAYEALSDFWPDRERAPRVENLDDSAKALVFLRVGSLAGWLGSASQTPGSQETAKNFITNSIELYERLGATRELAEARSDLALCYWREGAHDEAKINFQSALALLGEEDQSELKAVVLIRATVVELDTQRLQEALRCCEQAASIVDASQNHSLKGSFHMQYAITLRRLATPENREDYLDRALIEYTAAIVHFEEVGHRRYIALIENNLGNLLRTTGRYQDAHHHLDRARRLFVELKAPGQVAQVDDTRAQTLLAEGRLAEAERVIRSAVRTQERGGEQALLAESLITFGIVKARLGKFARARALLESAGEIAQTAGHPEGAGRARLVMLEELGTHMPLQDLPAIYYEAAELLEHSQEPTINKRLINSGRKIIEILSRKDEIPIPVIESWEGFSLKREVNKVEKGLVERALRDAGGSVTRAARLLGFKHHQSLIALLNSRQKDLNSQRSAIRKRRRALITKPKPAPKKIAVE
jgi:tetratricopeptide (TPR) repeat protein